MAALTPQERKDLASKAAQATMGKGQEEKQKSPEVWK